MNPVEMLVQAATMVTGHKWMPLAVLLDGWVVMLLRRDSRFPISVPAGWDANRWKPLAVLVASAAYGGLTLLLDPQVHWDTALMLAVRNAVFTLGLYAVVIKAIFGDHVPDWLQRLALIFPPPAQLPDVPKLDVPPPSKPPTQ